MLLLFDLQIECNFCRDLFNDCKSPPFEISKLYWKSIDRFRFMLIHQCVLVSSKTRYQDQAVNERHSNNRFSLIYMTKSKSILVSDLGLIQLSISQSIGLILNQSMLEKKTVFNIKNDVGIRRSRAITFFPLSLRLVQTPPPANFKISSSLSSFILFLFAVWTWCSPLYHHDSSPSPRHQLMPDFSSSLATNIFFYLMKFVFFCNWLFDGNSCQHN